VSPGPKFARADAPRPLGASRGHATRSGSRAFRFTLGLLTILAGAGDAWPAGSVFVADSLSHEVREYDSEVGVPIRTFASIDTPVDVAYGPDGNLYVASQPPAQSDRAEIIRIDPKTGDRSVFATHGIEGIDSLAFGPNGHLFAGSTKLDSDVRVAEYDLATSSVRTAVAGPVGAGGLGGVAVLANGDILVSEVDGIRRYSGSTGELLGVLTSLIAVRLAVAPNGNVLAVYSNGLRELDPTTGATVRDVLGGAIESFTQDADGNFFVHISDANSVLFVQRSNPQVTRSLPVPSFLGGMGFISHPVFVVNTSLDTVDSLPADGRCQDANGSCSLRAALVEANALAGRESIILPADTLSLSRPPPSDNEDIDEDTEGDLDVRTDVDIVGMSKDESIVDAGGVSRILQVAEGTTCFIKNVTLRNGHIEDYSGAGVKNTGGRVDIEDAAIIENVSDFSPGGGIFNQGTMNVRRSDISDNEATETSSGGIWNIGVMLLADCNVERNTAELRASISNSGQLTILRSRIFRNGAFVGSVFENQGELVISKTVILENFGNLGGQGGGLFNAGNATIDDSAIVGNITEMDGGGIFNLGTLRASNVTISGNKVRNSAAPGGGIANEGTLELSSCTIAGNSTEEGPGGGLAQNGTLASVRNTIIADNHAGGDGDDCTGTINSQGYNLISVTDDCSIQGDTTGNETDRASGLGPLIEEAGTFVHSLLPGSPAVGTGSPADPGSGGGACPAQDQRGVARPQPSGGRCDIGAYESTCGNGEVETEFHENCDDGNRAAGDCCSGTCQEDPSGTPCAGDTGPCADDVCQGDSCVTIENTQPCDDGNACTTGDSCGGGVCQSGGVTNCNDSIPCTTDSCTPSIGCVHTGVDALCADSNSCTANVCDPHIGCVEVPLSGQACPDGDACTVNETCAAGVCTSSALNCSDDDLCTTDTCDRVTGCNHNLTVSCAAPDACHEAGSCQPATGTCVYPPTDPDRCGSVGQCQLTATCNPATGSCTITPRSDGTPCDDGNACTAGDACVDGACRAGASVACIALDQCHRVGACDPETGTCTNPPQSDEATCDADGNACTRNDRCLGGVCIAGAEATCDARDSCHTPGACDPTSGLCSEPLRDCRDHDACTAELCDPSVGCLAVPLEGLGAVRCLFEVPGIRLPECGNDTLPRKVVKIFERAGSTMAGVDETATGPSARRSVRAANRLLRKLTKSIDRSVRKRKISSQCGDALGNRLRSATNQAALWLH